VQTIKRKFRRKVAKINSLRNFQPLCLIVRLKRFGDQFQFFIENGFDFTSKNISFFFKNVSFFIKHGYIFHQKCLIFSSKIFHFSSKIFHFSSKNFIFHQKISFFIKKCHFSSEMFHFSSEKSFRFSPGTNPVEVSTCRMYFHTFVASHQPHGLKQGLFESGRI
jgi:hypothetical protein